MFEVVSEFRKGRGYRDPVRSPSKILEGPLHLYGLYDASQASTTPINLKGYAAWAFDVAALDTFGLTSDNLNIGVQLEGVRVAFVDNAGSQTQDPEVITKLKENTYLHIEDGDHKRKIPLLESVGFDYPLKQRIDSTASTLAYTYEYPAKYVDFAEPIIANLMTTQTLAVSWKSGADNLIADSYVRLDFDGFMWDAAIYGMDVNDKDFLKSCGGRPDSGKAQFKLGQQRLNRPRFSRIMAAMRGVVGGGK